MRSRLGLTALVLTLFALTGAAARDLEIYFIDTEGGQATLLVTPAGQSMLIDTGYAMRGQRGAPPPPPGATIGRDATRILDTLRQAGVETIDYLLITHFHPDHAGGAAEIADRIPIATFIDYGEPLGTDRMANNVFTSYRRIRDAGRHIVARPGDRIPLAGIDATIVSAGGELIAKALPEGGDTNSACVNLEDHPEDGTENYRSIGVVFEYGAFRFLDLGDLSGNTLTRLACPTDLVGRVSVYLIAHHGDYDTNVPALYAALRPRVAIMNNGVTRGGHAVTFRTLRSLPWLEGWWQLHASRNDGVENADDDVIANVDDGTQTAFPLHLTASNDGRFRVTNARTGVSRAYPRRRPK